jgi:hypothetical protein
MNLDLIAGIFFGIGFCVACLSLYSIYENIMQSRKNRQKKHDEAIAQLKADVLNLCDEMKKNSSCKKS